MSVFLVWLLQYTLGNPSLNLWYRKFRNEVQLQDPFTSGTHDEHLSGWNLSNIPPCTHVTERVLQHWTDPGRIKGLTRFMVLPEYSRAFKWNSAEVKSGSS